MCIEPALNKCHRQQYHGFKGEGNYKAGTVGLIFLKKDVGKNLHSKPNEICLGAHKEEARRKKNCSASVTNPVFRSMHFCNVHDWNAGEAKTASSGHPCLLNWEKKRPSRQDSTLSPQGGGKSISGDR